MKSLTTTFFFILHPSSFILCSMSYQVIARNTGRSVSRMLSAGACHRHARNAIKQTRIAHAYLFAPTRHRQDHSARIFGQMPQRHRDPRVDFAMTIPRRTNTRAVPLMFWKSTARATTASNRFVNCATR